MVAAGRALCAAASALLMFPSSSSSLAFLGTTVAGAPSSRRRATGSDRRRLSARMRIRGPVVLSSSSTGRSNNQEHDVSTAKESSATTTNIVHRTVTLSKPLGLLLEEVQENAPNGVFVRDVSETGSAFPIADELRGKMIVKVMNTDCSDMDFDSVLDLIRNCDDGTGVTISYTPLPVPTTSTTSGTTATPLVVEYPVGTDVTITVVQPGGRDLVISNAKVGDNLRQTLLANNFEVYQGMRQKLGNCGGAGQCGFCAVTFINNEGWFDRSDYEDRKLAKFPNARLSCLNTIQGPATIEKTQR